MERGKLFQEAVCLGRGEYKLTWSIRTPEGGDKGGVHFCSNPDNLAKPFMTMPSDGEMACIGCGHIFILDGARKES